MHKQKTHWFTLVELIIVITILAILWTIAFISLQGYSTDARDSTRISDLSIMKTSLEIFQLDNWKYPIPTNWVDITYSWAVVWNQWIFWETVYANVDKLDKIPTDPNTNKQYTYSITANKTEYQLWWLLEWGNIAINNKKYIKNNIISYTKAWTTEATAYVTWNYNWLMTKSNSWTLCNIVSVPTIITNDTSVTDLQEIAENNSFVYRWYKNLPASFKSSKFKHDWWFNFKPNNLIAYTDTWSCTVISQNNFNSERAQLIKWLQNAYSWTILWNDEKISKILALDINENNPSNEVINYANNLVNNSFWSKLIVWTNNQTLVINNNTTLSETNYRISYDNPFYFSVNWMSTMDKNWLKLFHFPASNICYWKTVVCNAWLNQTECNRSCDQANNSTYEITTWTTWMKYDLLTPYIVNNVSTLSYYASWYESIKDFELYGSNNNTDFTKLWTWTHIESGAYYNTNINNTTAYRYYRFDILSHYPWNWWNNRYLRDLKLNSIESYPSDIYYTTTTNEWETLHLSNLWITSINKITVSDSKPTNTSIKYLFSFDWKNTWYYFDWTNWVQAVGWLNDIWTNWMTSEFINWLSDSNLTYLNTQNTIDIATWLYTSDVLETPTVNYIEFNYDSNTITWLYTSCKEIKDDLPSSTDWVYNIYPNYKYLKQVYCDMTTDWGGWTMVSWLSPTWAISYSDIAYTLTWNFVSPNWIMAELTNTSSETRYNCKRWANILDIKTSNSNVRERQYGTWLRCTNWYWYTFTNAASNFTWIWSNNYTPVTNTWHWDCLNASINLNVSAIWLYYSDWYMVDQTSKSLYCMWSWVSTEFMRVFVR